MMRKFFILGAAALLFASLAVDNASAQRGRGGMGGAGFSGMRVGGAGFSGMRVGAAGIGRGYVGRGYVGRGYAAPLGYRAAGLGWRGGPGWAGRRVAWGNYGRYGYRHYGWRRGYGWWGYPLAAGIGFAAATSYYDSCWQWDGWQYVNVCYGPYGYGGYYPY